jgi:AcrR family transcriptional regulator
LRNLVVEAWLCGNREGVGEMTVTTAQSRAGEIGERTSQRSPSGERATRIVEAMRESVAEVGIAGSTFERVAAKAGVSRGLLHYYFGTKERLVIEVLRRDSRLRMALLDVPLERAQTVDDVIDVLVSGAGKLARDHPSFYAVLFEVFIAGRRNPEIRRELAELYDAARRHVATALRKKEAEGVLAMRFDAETVVSYMFAATDGSVMQRFTDPVTDFSGMLETGIEVARFLLDRRA